MLNGGDLTTYLEDKESNKKEEKKSNIKVDGYIKTKKPIHIAHFSIKMANDDLFKNRINKDDSTKIFSIINKMIKMNKENKIELEEIKNELNLDNSNDKIEQIDEIIDKESILNDDYKFGIYMSKEKETFHDEIENNDIETINLYNSIPHEIIFMLNDKRYKLDDDKNIILCKKNEKCEKNGFANYNFTPENLSINEDEKDDFFLRNVIFNNFFKYGISKITNKKINFEINFSKSKKDKYKIIVDNSENEDEEEEDNNQDEIIDNIFLFRDIKNLHFIYFLEENIDGYINFINNDKEKEKRKIFIKNKIRNIDINKNK